MEQAFQFGEAVSKFKVGDSVVRIADGHWNIGQRAVIVGAPDPTCFAEDWSIAIEGDTEEYAWHESRMELESIYNSPLYQALK